MLINSMSDRLPAQFDSWPDPGPDLSDEFIDLWAEADELWDQFQDAPEFEGYVSSDYQLVYESLSRLRGRVLTVLEWGSGLGIVTIMASRMGFEAYGIEAEAKLVSLAESLAVVHGPEARFAHGSFIPDDFDWVPDTGGLQRTVVDVAAAYDELDMELRDFDLIYAYPWPDEHAMFRNIIRQFGHRRAMLLCYDAREGMELVRYPLDD